MFPNPKYDGLSEPNRGPADKFEVISVGCSVLAPLKTATMAPVTKPRIVS